MAVSKRLRYEILRRDDHACRYCGATAPEVKLTVDHVLPVALGGTDKPNNLVTACAPCNSGKTSSAPDAPLVEEIDDKALVWMKALAIATERRKVRLEHKRRVIDWFNDEWNHRYNFAAPLPGDWEETVFRFANNGLARIELEDAIDIAYQSNAALANIFKYFCGVCWRKIESLQDEAGDIIENGEVEHGS